MTSQPTIRPIVFGAFLALLVILAAAGGQSVSAEVKQVPDFGSKANFKLQCELLGGRFVEDPLGDLECHWPTGDYTDCDSQGNDCWYTPGRVQSDGGRGGIAPGSVAEDPTPRGRFDGVLAPSGNEVAAPAP